MRSGANILAFIVALTSFACSGDSVTTPPPTQVPVSSVTVAGTVWLHDTGGVKPYASVQMHAYVEKGTSGQVTAPISSGPDGRYSFAVPTGSLVRVYTDSLASYQPCVTAIAATGNTNLDVHAIVDSAQLGAHLPSELLNDTPTLSGTVFETTALGRQPVPGVRLQLDMFHGLGDVSAQTLTDSDGRYVLCGLGGAATAFHIGSPYVYVSKSGYRTYDVGTVQVNGNTILDIELQR